MKRRIITTSLKIAFFAFLWTVLTGGLIVLLRPAPGSDEAILLFLSLVIGVITGVVCVFYRSLSLLFSGIKGVRGPQEKGVKAENWPGSD